jgi:hypothetical protein|tara:strand:- start:3998 stop:5671 length:1674 start_codon:yes stop_codon:yes gene_type:complete
MKDTLARNPQLDDIIRKAANRLGENHGLTRDNHGATIDNQGNSARYVGSGGQHPAQLNKPKSSKTFGWHKTLNEGNGHPNQTCSQAHPDMDHEEWFDEMSEMAEMEEATGASSSGSFEGPLFSGPMREQDKRERLKISDREYEEIMGSTQAMLDMRYGGKEVNLYSDEDDSGYEGEPLGSWRIEEVKLDSFMDKKKYQEDTAMLEFDFKLVNHNEGTMDSGVLNKYLGQGYDSDFMNDKDRIRGGWACLDSNFRLQTGWGDDAYIPFTNVQLIKDLNDMCKNTIYKDYDKLFGVNNGYILQDMDVDFTMDDEEMDMDVELAESRILKTIIREEVSKKVSKQQLKESLKNRVTRNILNEKAFYNDGKFEYEKPTKLPGEIKSMPGMKQTDSILKKSQSTNNEYLKHFDNKIKDYLDFEGNSHPEFPHQNNSKTDYKSPMYRNTGEDQEFIDDFRGMGLEDANGVDMLDRVGDYLSGSQETGNAQTDKDGKALGNVVPNKTGERVLKKVKRKKAKIAKQKSKMTNLRGMTPDVQTTTTVKESVEIDRMKKLISYRDTTQ